VTLALVMLGGAVGAALRFVVGQAITARIGGPVPWGTFAVNVVGSFLLGVLSGAGDAVPGWLGALGVAGFCGALTTYSTFSLETVELGESGRPGRRRALLYAAGTVLIGVPAAALGWAIAATLGGA
jgi:CrcB protein